MHTENYKKRAVDVRREARANLARIRQSRIAQRAQILEAVQTVPAQEDLVGPDETDIEAGYDDLDEAMPVSYSTETRATDEITSPNAVTEGDHDALDEFAEKNASLADVTEMTEAEVVGHEQPIALQNDQDHHGSDAMSSGDLMDNDLAIIPGAGPGLVWMLNQCGDNAKMLHHLVRVLALSVSYLMSVNGSCLPKSRATVIFRVNTLLMWRASFANCVVAALPCAF